MKTAVSPFLIACGTETLKSFKLSLKSEIKKKQISYQYFTDNAKTLKKKTFLFSKKDK